jgi:hypothetical protein
MHANPDRLPPPGQECSRRSRILSRYKNLHKNSQRQLTRFLGHWQGREEGGQAEAEADEQGQQVTIADSSFCSLPVGMAQVNDENAFQGEEEHGDGDHGQEEVAREGDEEEQWPAVVELWNQLIGTVILVWRWGTGTCHQLDAKRQLRRLRTAK